MNQSSQPSILFIGPTPPPHQGVAVTTDCLLHSSLSGNFRIIHLDISDRRTMDNCGHLDFGNVYLALVHGARFLALFFRERPDIVYVPISQNALGFLRDSLFLIPAKLLHKKLVIHLHGGAFDRFYAAANSFVQVLARIALSRVDLAVVLHEKYRGIFGELIAPERVVAVENGIVDEFVDEFAGEFSGAEPIRRVPAGRRLQVLFLSILVESKGFVDLLHAVPVIVGEIPDVEFVFVGDGTGYPEFEKAQVWVRERELGGYVKFLGPKWGEEKIRILLGADIFAFPTWYPHEGQPRVVIEAMAAKLPMVTTRHAAIEETVGEAGALYARPRDPGDLAVQLITLLKDPMRRAAMGRRNRLRFVERYTVDRFAADLGAAFHRVLGETPSVEGRVLETKAVS
jgi:glycosyltransferase involved in cell wall biosynthesis